MIVRLFLVVLLAITAAYLRPIDTPVWEAALVGAAAAVLVVVLERRAERISLQRLIGLSAGVVVGLVCAVLMSIVLGGVTANTSFLRIACMIVLIWMGAVAGAAKGELLNLGALGGLFNAETDVRKNQKILDTSAIIDGRIADIAETGFLDGVLIVPQFVLHELQMVADSADSMKRNRGRRGLDMLQRLQKMPNIDVQIVADDFPKAREVDTKLIELASLYKCKIITNDFNLNKVAHVRGVEVLNINELANSLKPIVLPGELMRVFILKEGKEYNQGVAYLDDGTMVVVDNARRMISRTVDISVTSVLQTTAGKMIFGKFDERLQSNAAAATAGSSSPSVERREPSPRREQVVGEN